jgi:hypothetical protein
MVSGADSDPISHGVTITLVFIIGVDTLAGVRAYSLRSDLPRNIGYTISTLVGLTLFGGCCSEKREEVWIAPPRVHWEHVSTDPVRAVDQGYRILLREPTSGMFPASIGVTRIAIEVTDERAQSTKPLLMTNPRNEFLQWNRAFDDLMAISEVFPIVNRDLGGHEADPPQIIAATRALHAKLGMVYAVNELSPTVVEMFGVIYDTKTARPIASIHAREESEPRPEVEPDEHPDLWKTDARALVRQAFERRVHACLREMIERDERTTTKIPEGWTPAGPVRPVEWPPRHFRTGRP